MRFYVVWKPVLLAGLLFTFLSANASGFTSEQLRAPFLLHIAGFTQFSESPAAASPLYFCFLEGKDFPHAKVFRQAPDKKVQQRSIHLITLGDISELPQQHGCHLLFISAEQESEQLFDLLDELNQNTISVGESLNFIEQGGMMAILPLQSKMKIFFNREAYQNTELKFSSALLKRVNFR